MKTKLLIAGLVCAFFLTACEDRAENYPSEATSSVSESASENIDTDAQGSVTESTALTESVSISAETALTAAVTEITTVTESISATAAEKGNTLFENILPQMDMLRFFTFDEGEVIRFAETHDASVAQEVFDTTAAVAAEKTEDWSANMITFPIYGFYGYDSKEEIIFSAAWSNGFLIDSDGNAYRFDCDFSAFETGYGWGAYGYYGNGYVSNMPCGYFLSIDENGWIKDNIPKRLPFYPAKAPEDVTVEYIGFDSGGGLSLLMTNNRETDLYFFEYFQVEVLLDGEWRVVPPRSENLSFSDVRIKIPAGTSLELVYPLEKYGSLPAGDYRIVGDGFYVEFAL